MNKLTDKIIQQVYANYAVMDLEEFRSYCKKLVKEARKTNFELLEQLDTMKKDRALLAINNFFLKGQGYGVLAY